MAWNNPKANWQADEIVTAADMNDIGENLATLRNPGGVVLDIDESPDFTTTSAIFVTVDPNPNPTTNAVTAQITSTGRPLMVSFAGSVTHSSFSDTAIYFDVTLDGVRAGGDDGILRVSARSGESRNASFVYWLTGVAAGSHEVILKWRTSSGTATMWSGAGTSGADLHPQFAVREVM